MSWIDKELRRRQKQEANSRESTSTTSGDVASDAERIAALWKSFEDTNGALPPELKLARETPPFPPELGVFMVLLKARNGAGIGLAGNALRYVWPDRNAGKSNNFWIKCHPRGGFVLSRRVKPGWFSPSVQETHFNEASVDHIVKCLVTRKRVTWRAIRRRRLWIF